MSTFVLVHGGFVGGWFWQKVARLLRAEGHEVYTPTLTGLGERAHLADPDVSLATHAQDVASVIEFERLEHVVFVGHSYGGMVVSAAAELVSARLDHIVYLDAFVPADAQSMADQMPPELWAQLQALAGQHGDGWRLPMPFPPESLGIVAEADREWMFSRITDQPLRPVSDPVRLRDARAAALPRTFVYCNSPSLGLLDAAAAAIRGMAGWRYRELATGHAAPLLVPCAVASELVLAASSAAAAHPMSVVRSMEQPSLR